MSSLSRLSSFALRPLLPGIARLAAEATGCSLAKMGVDIIEKYLLSRFTDPSREMQNALGRAADRSWACLEIALGGASILGWLTRRGEDKAFTATVRTFLDANPLQLLPGQDERFRGQALSQLRTARKTGLIRGTEDTQALSKQVAEFARFTDPTALHDAEWRLLAEVAGQLRQAGYDSLAKIVALRLDARQPSLLAVAVRFFFRREIETNGQLFQGLVYEQVDGLRHELAAGLDGLHAALEGHRERFEAGFVEMLAVAEETRDNVLDLKAEQARQGEVQQALYATIIRLGEKLDHLHERPLRTNDGLSIRGEAELRLVREAVARYRALPEEERRRMPALLNAVGKLEVTTGDFKAAQRDFDTVAALVTDTPARGEAHMNAYRAALEQGEWDRALRELLEGVKLDGKRFAPFPMGKYRPKRILGAGGFGAAFLCRHKDLQADVVVKALLHEDLDRDMDEVFREARLLWQLDHPGIIRLLDCGYTIPAQKARPYLVMAYFDGVTLEEHVRKNGPLPPGELRDVAQQLAAGLKAAHDSGILHRDIKPGNILLRKTATGWAVKIIDFGLAVRPQALHNTMSNADALAKTNRGHSIAGTIDYAAPEEMGKLRGVAVGTYSDVYAFGRTVCFAVFATHQPLRRHWREFPDDTFAALLERCIEEQPNARPRDFGQILDELTTPPKPADVLADFEEYLRIGKKGSTRPYLEQAAPQRIERWRKVAEQGVAEAAILFADCYEEGLGVAQDYGEAMKWYRKAADQGSADAMLNIGALYRDGDGVAQNYGEAMKWYRKAAELGVAKAMSRIGALYWRGQGVAQDYGEAMKWYRKAAELGYAAAMDNVGWLYQNGWGVAQHYGEAMKWYRKAAELGDADAMNNIGSLYYNGQGVAQDYGEAMKWFRKAADSGDSGALNWIGWLYQHSYGVAQDYGEAMKWYRKAAELGDATAMYNVGILYDNGLGVAQDYSEAMKWYRKAADQGSADAMLNIGGLYWRGLGVAQHYGEAMKWYRKAAELGVATAMYNVGILYDNGEGVAQDYSEAMKWYRKAAELGDAKAMDNVGWLYHSGRGVAQDYGEAMKWYRKAANLGNATAMNSIGALYYKGHGLAQDYGEGMKWYRKAAELGDAAAMDNIGWLYQNGQGVAQDYAEAMKWYRKAAELDEAGAVNKIGWLYHNGWGVAQDYGEAIKWFRKAAELGLRSSQCFLGVLHRDGIGGVPKDLTEARRWLRLAAAQGDEDAKNALQAL